MNKTVRETIVERRSIKLFNGQPVAKEVLVEMVEDAVYAPNHGNREPWRLILGVEDSFQKVLELLRDTTIPKWQELSEEELNKQMAKFSLAGGVMFVIVKEDRRQKERLEDFAAASCLIQNLQLLAWDRGIGTCWKTPPFIEAPAFNEKLGVQPGERIIGMLQFGYYDEAPKAKARKSADEIMTIFGE